MVISVGGYGSQNGSWALRKLLFQIHTLPKGQSQEVVPFLSSVVETTKKESQIIFI